MRQFVFCLLLFLGCLALPAAERVVQPVVITTKPKVEQRGQFLYLVVADTNQSFEIAWGMLPNTRFVPVSLDTNLVYTFTVGERAYQNTISIPELQRVRLGDKTVYDIEVCEVHKVRMDNKEMHISYGLPSRWPDEPPGETERQWFPPPPGEFARRLCRPAGRSEDRETLYLPGLQGGI